MARPSEYTQESADKICSLLADGMSLRAVCREEKMPDKATVFRWLREHKEFRDQYARATEERTEAQSEILLEIGDESIEAAHSADPKAANAVVSGYKLKADNLKWSMSKMKPKKYGDKIDVTSGGEKLPTPIVPLHGIQPDNSVHKDSSTD